MMNRWSIRTRTLFLGLAPTLLLFASLMGYDFYSRLQELDGQLRSRGDFMARQLAPACEYGVISGNTEILRNLLKTVVKEPGVVFVEVRNQDNKPLIKVDNDRIGSSEYRQYLFEAPITMDDLAVDPLSGSDGSVANRQSVGHVILGLSDRAVEQQQLRIVWVGGLMALASLLLAVAWAMVIARGLSRPIIELSDTVRQLKGGKLDTRARCQSGGEIGSLESDINALADSLETAQAAEKVYTENLIRARESADAANHAKSQFLANMSHELRTPMNGTLGMLQLLQETELTGQQEEYVDTAVDATEHLLTVINDILDFSKIDEGKLQLEQLYFDLHELVTRVANSFQKEAGSRGLVLRTEFVNAPGPHEVLGDPTRIRQILINLVSNALKFTEAGHINVRCEWRLLTDETLEVILSVIDTGVGIPEERLDTIFMPFTQGDTSMARRHGGTGLGLAICKQLAGLMQGLLTVSSRPGFGARFDLRLPMPFRRVSHKLHTPAPPPLSRLSGRVLLAEDNTVNQMVVKGFLHKMGLEVELANDGKQAVEMFVQSPFQLVIMDCQMPVMDGYEATAHLRRLEKDSGRRIPIIALTAHAMQGDRERCLAAGMDDYLAKPVKKEDLHATLQRWLGSDSTRDIPAQTFSLR